MLAVEMPSILSDRHKSLLEQLPENLSPENGLRATTASSLPFLLSDLMLPSSDEMSCLISSSSAHTNDLLPSRIVMGTETRMPPLAPATPSHESHLSKICEEPWTPPVTTIAPLVHLDSSQRNPAPAPAYADDNVIRLRDRLVVKAQTIGRSTLQRMKDHPETVDDGLRKEIDVKLKLYSLFTLSLLITELLNS